MTYVESPTQTLTRFISTWKETPQDRLSDEIISAFNETHRKPDDYKFKLCDGQLVDYKTGIQIKIDTSTYLGKKDNELLEVLNYWANENINGTALWISPSYDSSYPCNKITMYQLQEENGEKITINISVLFDTPKEHTLSIAEKLNPSFINTKDPETLRNKLFIVDENFDLTSLLKLIGEKQYFPETPSQELVNYFIGQIYSGRDPRDIAYEMEKRGMIGEFSVSCGGGSTLNNSLTINLKGEINTNEAYFECPRCHGLIKSGLGITTCPHCGLTKEQAGSSCV